MNENNDIVFETNFGERKTTSIIKVIGIGGAGNNAVQHMYNEGIQGVDFLICNTDRKALETNAVSNKLVLGEDGLGAGGNPENAKALAVASEDRIREFIGEETRMLFITAGMGKGTGTGASPVVAKIAHEMGILTIGVITYPYELEGPVSYRKANVGIDEMKKYVDSLIIIQNEKIMVEYENEPIRVALGYADDVLKNAVKSIAELITMNAYQNVDFNDVLTVMKDSGEAMIGLAEASGPNRIEEVVSRAMTCPLIDDTNITNAQNFLFFIYYGENGELTIGELKKLSQEVKAYRGPDTNVIWGHGVDKSLGDKIKLAIIVTGYSKEVQPSPIDDFFKNNESNPSDPFTNRIPSVPENTLTQGIQNQGIFDFSIGEQASTGTPAPQSSVNRVPPQSQGAPSLPPQAVAHSAETNIHIVNTGSTSYDDDGNFKQLVEEPAYLRNTPATIQEQRKEELKKQNSASPTPMYAGSFLFGNTPSVD